MDTRSVKEMPHPLSITNPYRKIRVKLPSTEEDALSKTSSDDVGVQADVFPDENVYKVTIEPRDTTEATMERIAKGLGDAITHFLSDYAQQDGEPKSQDWADYSSKEAHQDSDDKPAISAPQVQDEQHDVLPNAAMALRASSGNTPIRKVVAEPENGISMPKPRALHQKSTVLRMSSFQSHQSSKGTTSRVSSRFMREASAAGRMDLFRKQYPSQPQSRTVSLPPVVWRRSSSPFLSPSPQRRTASSSIFCNGPDLPGFFKVPHTTQIKEVANKNRPVEIRPLQHQRGSSDTLRSVRGSDNAGGVAFKPQGAAAAEELQGRRNDAGAYSSNAGANTTASRKTRAEGAPVSILIGRLLKQRSRSTEEDVSHRSRNQQFNLRGRIARLRQSNRLPFLWRKARAEDVECS